MFGRNGRQCSRIYFHFLDVFDRIINTIRGTYVSIHLLHISLFCCCFTVICNNAECRFYFHIKCMISDIVVLLLRQATTPEFLGGLGSSYNSLRPGYLPPQWYIVPSMVTMRNCNSEIHLISLFYCIVVVTNIVMTKWNNNYIYIYK